ncbi:DUF1674 domain-containing protein [Spiribacter pallidus]|jgi:hypothetical protein|uniref:DUF1674 domain-containing protein n=1 Tax=Spiribacter pallidus TaxID=1987936 RepID=A0ABV3TAZ1_9GAMM
MAEEKRNDTRAPDEKGQAPGAGATASSDEGAGDHRDEHPSAGVDWQKPETWPREVGGNGGPEPTRYGDWESNGRCTDF